MMMVMMVVVRTCAHLVSGDEGQSERGGVAALELDQLAVAHAHGLDPHEHVPAARMRHRHLARHQRQLPASFGPPALTLALQPVRLHSCKINFIYLILIYLQIKNIKIF
jgi:hypothetical protein